VSVGTSQPPSAIVTRREVEVRMVFLVDGFDQATAEQWVAAGISLAVPQGSTFRQMAVTSKPAILDLVKPH